MPLFGKDAKLYYSANATFNGTNAVDDLTWTEMDKIQDETDNFSPVEDDVTTRASAAQGIATSAIVLGELELSFSYIMDPASNNAAGLDTPFMALWNAQKNRTAFCALALSGGKTSNQSIGIAANFSVALNWQKNIRNKQLANFTLKPLQYPQWVEGSSNL